MRSEGSNCEKDVIIRREFRSINDFILQNWGHVLTPFLDTYQDNEAWIGRWKSGDWSTRKLSKAYNTDDKAAGYN